MTPYVSEEQIVSGALAYAVGIGAVTVSTPYWYAKELLAEGRGRLVPFADSEAMTREINDLLDHEDIALIMRKKGYQHGRAMIWSRVAQDYVALYGQGIGANCRPTDSPVFRKTGCQNHKRTARFQPATYEGHDRWYGHFAARQVFHPRPDSRLLRR